MKSGESLATGDWTPGVVLQLGLLPDQSWHPTRVNVANRVNITKSFHTLIAEEQPPSESRLHISEIDVIGDFLRQEVGYYVQGAGLVRNSHGKEAKLYFAGPVLQDKG